MLDNSVTAIGPAAVLDPLWLAQEIAAAEARIAGLDHELQWRTEQEQSIAAESVRAKLAVERAALERLRADRERLDEERARARDLLLSTRRAAHLARQAYESWLTKEYFAAAALLIAGRQLELAWIGLHGEFERAADAILGTADIEARAEKVKALFAGHDGGDEITAPPVSMVLASGKQSMLLAQFLRLPAVATLHQMLDSTPPDQVPVPICESVK